MKVLLLRPPDPLQEVALLSHTRPMNLAYLAAWLRRGGDEVVLVDYEIEPYTAEHLTAILRRERPAVVGFSCTTPTVLSGARLAARIKALDPGIITVVGGAHANGLPRQTLEEFPDFDCLVFGEGEVTFAELCRAVGKGGSLEGVCGLVFRQGDKVVENPPRPLIADLDELPLPARDLFAVAAQAGHTSRGFSNRLRSAELFTARGCPIACSFCAIQTAFGRSVRLHSPERIAAEVQHLTEQYGCEHLVIADDTFTLQEARAQEISAILGRSGLTSWNCDTRVNTVTPGLLQTMAANGCRKVAFGVESGSQRIIDRIGKKITIEQVRAAVRWAKEAKIPEIEGNFIIAADPGEDRGDLEETRRLITALPWTFVSVSIIVPYPGTPVYTRMRAAGQIDPVASWEDFVMFGREPRWHTDHFTAAELLALQKSLTRAFYLRPGYIASRLATIRSIGDLNYWIRAGIAYLRWYRSGKI